MADCIYRGTTHKRLRNCTGTARKARAADGSLYVNLWAFRLSGTGEIVWVQEADLQFFEPKKAKSKPR